MRFGGRWKLIDLEGAVPLEGAPGVEPGGFTPLYVCPELARRTLQAITAEGKLPALLADVAPASKMDVWSAGVVLLDVMARRCALEETYAGFQAQALMDFEVEDTSLEALRQWYEWLGGGSPVDLGDYLPPEVRASVLEASSDLRDLLQRLLAKDPEDRLSAEAFLAHPALAAGPQPQEPAEAEASKAAGGAADAAAPEEGEPGEPPEEPRPARCFCLRLCWRPPAAQGKARRVAPVP